MCSGMRLAKWVRGRSRACMGVFFLGLRESQILAMLKLEAFKEDLSLQAILPREN